MSTKKRILLICDANLSKAPRVRMTYEALQNEFDFIMAGYEAPPFDDVEYIPLPRKKKPRRRNINFHLSWPAPVRKIFSVFIKFYLLLFSEKEDKRPLIDLHYPLLKDVSCDLIINHHLATLETAVRLKHEKQVKLISNLHEYYPREFEDQAIWMKYEGPKITKICQEYLVQADAVFSVCEGIRQEYLKEFGVDSVVVRNDKPYADLPLQNNEGPIKLIHHGAALKSRHLEKLIEAVKPLKGTFLLDLMLIPTQEDCYLQLSKMCEDHDHIRIIEAVSPKDIIPFINTYDVGVFLLKPVNFNYEMALPNKLFEFIQARLAIVISPNQEMARIVNHYDLGFISSDYSPESFRDALKKLTRENIAQFKQSAHEHALELSSEQSKKHILATVKSLIQ
jgi:glycosyltransferase involved in cell wall biosynthesis